MGMTHETGGPAFPHYGGAGWMGPGMTLRQYAAIKLRVPNSGTDWLDAMIREAMRDEFAAKAIQGMLSDMEVLSAMSNGPRGRVNELAAAAYEVAAAMIVVRGGKMEGGAT